MPTSMPWPGDTGRLSCNRINTTQESPPGVLPVPAAPEGIFLLLSPIKRPTAGGHSGSAGPPPNDAQPAYAGPHQTLPAGKGAAHRRNHQGSQDHHCCAVQHLAEGIAVRKFLPLFRHPVSTTLSEWDASVPAASRSAVPQTPDRLHHHAVVPGGGVLTISSLYLYHTINRSPGPVFSVQRCRNSKRPGWNIQPGRFLWGGPISVRRAAGPAAAADRPWPAGSRGNSRTGRGCPAFHTWCCTSCGRAAAPL